ncbi:Pentatricopeptide repeat-containing protein, mitochondrial [Heracleum sosnowskyi]|uniref:Pentatricopeptide repeat-containing protein, mitochondrial n=1 Tax=Heracleum sosnowskyi TaxID=360622 RepID=A0AAD8ITH2_9APIA|nr:Pentatricopeptide repeat-containing protein, mitochondrial [Heracleum sosnowskyi]
MWRSVAAAISRKSKLSGETLNLALHSQVLHFNTPKHVAFLAPKFNFQQNPRFFSQDSSNPVATDAQMPQFEPLVSEEGGENDVFKDAHNLFDEMSEEKKEGFDENVTGDVVGDDDSEVGVASEEVVLEKMEHLLSLLQSGNVDDGALRSFLGNDISVELLEKFVVRVIETPPLISGEILIGFVKLVLEKEKLAVTPAALEALVMVIGIECKRSSAYALWDFFKEVGEDGGVLTTEILNGLLSLLSVLGKGKACYEVFNKFEEFNCVPNEESFYFTIDALCRRSIFDWAVSVCEMMVSARKLPDSEKVGNIITGLCKGKKAKDAHALYLFAKKQDKCPPRSSVNFLISSLCREDVNVPLALEMLNEVSKEERKDAIKLFSRVIQGLCRVKDTNKAKVLLFDMIKSGPPPGNAVFNSIINSLSKAGEMKEATKIMKVMESRGLKPDVYSYSVIISGYSKGGEMEEARKVLDEAKTKHSKLTPVTYHTLIRGYCKLERFDEALELLGEMKQFGVQPNADEYNKLIQSLCLKALDWETADKLREEMENNGLYLNGITTGLIRAVKELEEEEEESADAGVEVIADVS